MKPAKDFTTKLSETAAVDMYMQKLAHPLAAIAEVLRQVILGAASQVGEEIKWNAPPFFIQDLWNPSMQKNTGGILLYLISEKKTVSG